MMCEFVTLQDSLTQIFDDAGGSDALVNLLTDFDFESSRELAEALVFMASGRTAADERQALIVKWLRDADLCPFGKSPAWYADAIERGDHLQTKPD